ncbi:MHS family alpha-ketoglutarate permease-like MFS transporter [Thermocatellispora tengchongensis]|uniref:Putative proline/betaine transporter n=2 Tax=Thermocatellispora tengchongensis TaxID=1073253 RepID=A0A840PXJ3_9ACTN|nr:MFS transporter [Thermocatellispora tengchongensis]MBB5140575.1 MHS family alpha-ketoglutarate permease-like MFS transporter [Thermocatellispora tengchongensis]
MTAVRHEMSDRASRARQLAAAAIGNLVEWFDWYAYSVLAIYFADQFFPSSSGSGVVSLLGALAVFAVGFFMRPLGGLLVGALADRHGRKMALTFTMSLMGGGSLLIALAPTYAQIGVFAPALLLLARLVQGLSTGGEFASASAFLVESAPPDRRGLFSSFFHVSANIGNLAALGLTALLATVLTEETMRSWGWRVPFLVGASAALVGLWIRRRAEETHIEAEEIRAGRARKPAMFEFVRHYPRQSLQVAGITVAPALIFYVWAVFLPTYAQLTVGYDEARSVTIAVISLVFFTALQPLFGMLSDRIGRKPMLLVFALGFTVGTVPLLNGITTSFVSLLFVQCVGLALLACYTSIAAAVMAELFPARVRGAGIGFPYAVVVAAFGGTGPYVATWLHGMGKTGLFAWYIAGCALVSLATYMTLRETHRAPLPA